MLFNEKSPLSEVVDELKRRQEMWMKAVLLTKLGEEFYGKTDREIALEAGARGYKLVKLASPRVTDDPINPVMYEMWDKDDNVISSFRVNFNYNRDF